MTKQMKDVSKVGNQIEIVYAGGLMDFEPYSKIRYVSLLKQTLLYHKQMLEEHKDLGTKLYNKLKEAM